MANSECLAAYVCSGSVLLPAADFWGQLLPLHGTPSYRSVLFFVSASLLYH
jgi:hypothetical protein